MKRDNSLFFLGIGILSLCASCGNENKTTSSKQNYQESNNLDSLLPKGEVLKSELCIKDSSQSYALFLPSFYSPAKKWPIIYFFDPHACGVLPIDKYKLLAEKYGYVIAGSNNSKNGLDLETEKSIADRMMDDTKKKISIDKNRIYTGGFSGGSRVASFMAITESGITGVIGCAAGFPNVNKPLEYSFNYIGIVGNEDFNLLEMENLNKALSTSGLPQELIIYNGKHEWPPEQIMEEAFVWLEINEMKKDLSGVKESLIKKGVQFYEQLASHYLQSGNSFEAYITYGRLVNLFDGIFDISIYKKLKEELGNSKKMKQIFKMKEDGAILEINKQNEYMNALSSENTVWWKTEIDQLNRKIKNNEMKRAMNLRLLGFLSLSLYMYSSSALKNANGIEGEHFLELYRMVDPENSDAYYLSACLAAKQNDNRQTLAYLQQSVKFGFNDEKKFKQDPFFEAFRKIQPALPLMTAE